MIEFNIIILSSLTLTNPGFIFSLPPFFDIALSQSPFAFFFLLLWLIRVHFPEIYFPSSLVHSFSIKSSSLWGWFSNLCLYSWIQLNLPSLKCIVLSPDWCSSVDWALACEPKGHRFSSQSGYMPRLWARSPVRDVQGGNHLMLHSFSFSCLSKNK